MAKIIITGKNGETETLTTESLTRSERRTVQGALDTNDEVALFEVEATTQDEQDAWGPRPAPRSPGSCAGTMR